MLESETVAAVLLPVLNDRDVFTGKSAAVALGFYTNQAPAVVPALLKASENSRDYYVRPAAMQALRQIAPEAAAKAGVR